MKIIFLDFDGVLNSSAYLAEMKQGYEDYGSDEWWAAGLDKRLVLLLNKICDRTGAKVVVSSAWRTAHTVGNLNRILRAAGFTGEAVGKTPSITGADRSEEISKWLEMSKGYGYHVESYVILDDDNDAEIPGRFVQTSAKTGLTEADASRAVRILEEDS